jgi:plastocyanin
MRRVTLLLAVLALALGSVIPGSRLVAQEATPATAGITLAASGLENPRGFTWSPDGTLYVALAGSGGTSMSMGMSSAQGQAGPFFNGMTASVVRIFNGCPVTVAGGLPSTRGMSGHDQGPAAVAFLDGQLYVLQDAIATGQGEQLPNGVYVVNPNQTVSLVADITDWIHANPVANVPGDLTTEGEPFAMLAGDGFLWVLESNSGQVLHVHTDGRITRNADLSEGHHVPTGFALAPDGGVYVGFLTSSPYTDGSSKVVHVSAQGAVTDVWTGLTMVTGVAVAADGTLYALEMATGNTDTAPFVSPGTGKVVRQTGADSHEEVVTGLDFPIAMAMGPDGGLYVGFPAFGAQNALGGIVRVDTTAATPMTIDPNILAQSTCDVPTPVVSPTVPAPTATTTTAPTAAATTAASPQATAAIPATPATNDDGKQATGAQAIQIQNYAFAPASLTVPVGTTVTWTNLDSAPHTATSPSGAWDSGNLDQGESFSHTFAEAGSFDYHCSYHPNMTGTIVVQ